MKASTFFILLLMLLKTASGYSQSPIPTIKAKSKYASVRIGDKRYTDAWEMSPNPQSDPENINLGEVEENGTIGAIITDSDSLGFMIKRGQKLLFRVILNEKDTVWAIFKGGAPKSSFTEAYKKEHNDKTFIEIPEPYELVNIIMAITPRGIKDSNMINHDAAYYPAMMKYFSPFKNHRAVTVMDSLLKANVYYDVKMDAYSIAFKGDKLERKAVYDRISWGSENTILPYLSLFEDFAKKSKFSAFYKKNKPFYDRLIRVYRDSLGVPQMQEWLNNNFPTTRYNCFKIIFSPLVNADQSTTDFESNGFKEGQPHVNFPDYWYDGKTLKLSPKGVNIHRGNIVFTELNHLFENPEFEKNQKNIDDFMAIKLNLAFFTDKTKSAGAYSNPLSCVEEYMNWALVSLRFMDIGPKEDLENFFKDVENNQQNRRGFTQFKAFNRFLIKAYQERAKGQTVADLYPQIIGWFREHNK
jgi:hypothetical protein